MRSNLRVSLMTHLKYVGIYTVVDSGWFPRFLFIPLSGRDLTKCKSDILGRS